jgi:hypothetical protein
MARRRSVLMNWFALSPGLHWRMLGAALLLTALALLISNGGGH